MTRPAAASPATGFGWRAARAGAGAATLGLVLLLSLGAVAAIWLRGGGGGAGLRAADWRALEFTVTQAALSAALSVALGAAVARALSRRRFPGRVAAVALLGAPFLLPVIAAVLGLLAVWGRSGPISGALDAAGLGRLDIYGLPGILLAHVFFNMPLAARIFLHGYAAVPAERWRLAAQLGLEGRALWRTVERPVLAEHAPGAFALIFLLCAASFAVVLALGGGPKATTLELAIYEALRFEFDLPRAAALALMQMALSLGLAMAALTLSASAAADPGAGAPPVRWDGAGRGARAADAAVLVAAGLFLGAPLLAVVTRGAAGLADAPSSVWPALARSAGVALAASALAMTLAAGIAALALEADRRSAAAARAVELGALLALAAPPFVMGLGIFIVLREVADPFALALPVTAAVNAAMALPFALRLILPALRRARADHGRLADQLGLTGWPRFRHATWPALRRPAAFAAGLAAALAASDLGVIALFAPADAPTLPLLVHQLMGAYRMDAAAGASLLLLCLSLGLFVAIDRLGGRDA